MVQAFWSAVIKTRYYTTHKWPIIMELYWLYKWARPWNFVGKTLKVMTWRFSSIQHLPEQISVHPNTHSTCLLKYSGPLLRMRRGTVELKGVAGPAALLSGRAGVSVSVGMATRRLGWSAVVATGVGGSTRGGGTWGPPKHEDRRCRRKCLEKDEAPGSSHRPWDWTELCGWGQLHPLVFFLLAVLLQKQLRWSPSFWRLDSVDLFVEQDGQIDDRRRVNEQEEQ